MVIDKKFFDDNEAPAVKKEVIKESVRGPDLKMDMPRNSWERVQWEKFLNDTEGNEVPDGLDPRGMNKEKNEQMVSPTWPGFSRELFSRLLNADQVEWKKEPSPEHAWADLAHKSADEVREWDNLQRRCYDDETWSAMAALSIASSVKEVVIGIATTEDLQQEREQAAGLQALAQWMQNQADKEQDPARQQQQQEKADNLNQQVEDLMNQIQQKERQAQQQASQVDPSTMRQAVRAGINQAQNRIEETERAMSMLGAGKDPGKLQRSGGSQLKTALAKKIMESEKLRQIAKQAGRLRTTALRKARTKCKTGRSEYYGVELGDDIGRMLPSELIKLVDPALESLFYRGLHEKSLSQYRVRSRERENRGPIVVAIDTSGSMYGDKEVWSKAVALALISVAMEQKRPWGVMLWDTSLQDTVLSADGMARPEQMMEWLEAFSGGGTHMDVPLRESMRMINECKELRKADVILITDGCANISKSVQEKYLKASEENGWSTFGVQIGGGWESGLELLADICGKQNVHEISDMLSREDEDRILERIVPGN